MEIRGEKVVKEVVNVRVSVKDILENLKLEIKKKVFPKEWSKYDQFYLNSDGWWEGWDNGHGSGYTDVLRPATGEEKMIYENFNSSFKFISDILED